MNERNLIGYSEVTKVFQVPAQQCNADILILPGCSHQDMQFVSKNLSRAEAESCPEHAEYVELGCNETLTLQPPQRSTTILNKHIDIQNLDRICSHHSNVLG